MNRTLLIRISLAITIAMPATARAQTVGDVLTFLVTNQSVQTGSVDRDRDAAQATSDTIARALRANLATLPVTTSSGAFVSSGGTLASIGSPPTRMWT